MAARTDRRSKIAGQRPEVGAFSANDPKIDLRQFETGNFKNIDADGAGGEFEFFAAAGGFVGAFSIDFYGRKNGRSLLDFTQKLDARLVEQCLSEVLGRVGLVNLCFEVEARGGLAEADGAGVFFGFGLEFLDPFGECADADHQKPARERVEGACMADFHAFDAEPAGERVADFEDGVEARPIVRFIDEEHAAGRERIGERLAGK